MDDRFAIGCQQRPRPIEGGRITAYKDRTFARQRGGPAAGDTGVKQLHAASLRGVRQSPAQSGIDGRMDDEYSLFAQGGQQGAVADERYQVLVGPNAHTQHVDLVRDGDWIDLAHGSGLIEGRQSLRIDVTSQQTEPAACNAAGDWRT